MGSCFSMKKNKTNVNNIIKEIEIKNKIDEQNFDSLNHAFQYSDQKIHHEMEICDKYLCTKINIKQLKKPNINILYVEDNEIYFVIMKEIFHQYIHHDNVNLIMKKTISSAYEYIKNNDVDLIFLDRVLNNSNGWELGDTLYHKLVDDNYDVSKIIYISSCDNIEDIKNCELLGIKYFIKPIKFDKFVKFINDILQ